MQKPVETIPIAEGNLLEIYDTSRQIGQDLWLLKILFKAEIRIEEGMFSGKDMEKFNVAELMEALGRSVTFEIVRERNFIHGKDKDGQFQKLVEDYLDTNGNYLQDPGFPKKFIVRKFLESQKAEVSWTR